MVVITTQYGHTQGFIERGVALGSSPPPPSQNLDLIIVI